MGVDVLWLNETQHRGLGNSELLELANRLGRAVLTRDRDFTAQYMIKRSEHGIIYVSESLTKNNIPNIARNIKQLLCRGLLGESTIAIVTPTTVHVIKF